MSRVFVDTNVLVHLFDSQQPGKQLRSAEVLASVRRPVVSTQVLAEFYVTVTRKFRIPMSHAEAVTAISRMQSWQVVAVDEETLNTALGLVAQFSMSFWDAQVAASAAAAGCDRLITEDLSGPEVILGVVRENPYGVEA
jgi:predicted nucleic acid-binding protein